MTLILKINIWKRPHDFNYSFSKVQYFSNTSSKNSKVIDGRKNKNKQSEPASKKSAPQQTFLFRSCSLTRVTYCAVDSGFTPCIVRLRPTCTRFFGSNSLYLYPVDCRKFVDINHVITSRFFNLVLRKYINYFASVSHYIRIIPHLEVKVWIRLDRVILSLETKVPLVWFLKSNVFCNKKSIHQQTAIL